jgi:hypothetical protein
MKNAHLINALIKRLEGEIAVAEANVSVYLQNPAGIGEHSDIVESIETEIGKMAEAQDKIEACQRVLSNV